MGKGTNLRTWLISDPTFIMRRGYRIPKIALNR
jgi:hypothetical protein